MNARRPWVLMLLLLGAFAADANAARIGDLAETTVLSQVARFFTFQDPAVRYALAGSLLLGLACGLLGSFIVVRKMALMGDTLSHAVLPGVAAGFLWNMSKDPLAIFIGATVAGLAGAVLVHLIKATTRLKEDTALGMVLAGFFSIGICMVTRIQKLPTGNKSGIDKFLFGQAAAMDGRDLLLMGIITAVAVLIVSVFYKELLVTSFDAAFARVSGFPVHAMHFTLMLLLACAVVISLQAVGVVLVSAMLIIPAATAYLLTDRMHRMLFLSVAFGMFAGAAGAFFSFLGPSLPTGPFMVLAASALFAVAFCFGPRHGVLTRAWRQRSRTRQTQRENTLKAMYHVLEARNFQGEGILVAELAARRREDVAEIRRRLHELADHGLASFIPIEDVALFTPEGWQRACEIVRNHRLWELYLTNAAQIAADHVHDDAEKIEHVLGEEVVRELERRLQYARKDPHGRPIPTSEDIERGLAPRGTATPLVGFGKRV